MPAARQVPQDQHSPCTQLPPLSRASASLKPKGQLPGSGSHRSTTATGHSQAQVVGLLVLPQTCHKKSAGSISTLRQPAEARHALPGEQK